MEHRKLAALMSPMERIARVAAAGVSSSRAQQTSPSGAISLDNADGTRTIIGEVQNGEDNPSYTMATHVGDVTPPGVPTGITATSRSGVVVVEWDGTLSGGIPDDFFCVRIFLDGAELGALSEAGSVASAKLESGTTHQITATSEDDCCLPDGTPAHNVSEATQAISVTVAKDASEVMADIDDQIEGVEGEIADFKANTYTKTQVDKKVDEGPDSLKSWITANYTNSQDLGTTYATKTLVSQTKEEIELSASQTYSTKGESQPNLSPFFAHNLTDIYDATSNPGGYFAVDPTKSAELGVVGTQLGDGWMHVEMDNSERTAYAYLNLYQRAFANLEPATAYSLLVEVRDMETDATGAQLVIYSQADTSGSRSQTVNPSAYDDIQLSNGGAFLKAMVTKPDMGDATVFSRQTMRIAAGKKASFDIRLSLYETASPELLYDVNAPTLEKVDGPFGRYFSDAGQTQVQMAFGEIADPPEELGTEARYGYTATYDGSYAGVRYRALAFYQGEATGDDAFMEAGRQYQATWWARCTSGSAYAQMLFRSGSSNVQSPTSTTAMALTSEWRRYTATLRPTAAGYSRVWFRSVFAASTAGTVEMCGFSLREMSATFKPYVTDQTSLAKEYSTKAELRVGLDSVTSEVTKAYESIDATTLAPFADSVEGYLTSSAAGSATDPLHEPDARKERTSDYFDVTPGASYVFKGKATNESATDWMWRTWRFYDSSGKTLGGRQGGNVGQGADEFEVTFTAPEDAASCRVSMTCFEDGRWQVLGDLTKTTADLSSSIEQTAESIESTVSAQLSDVRILGENILRNVVKPEIAGQVTPADYDGKWFGSSGNQGAIVSAVDVTDSPQAGVTRAFHIDNSAYTGNRDAAQCIPDGIKADEQLAFSAWVRGVGSDCRAQVRVWNTAAPTGAKFTWSKVVGTAWERIVIPVTLTADTNAANLLIGIRGSGVIEWIAPVLLQGVDADLLAQDVEANYTKTSTFTQTVNGLDGRITTTEDGLAIQQTLIRQYAGGVLVAYTGNPVGALVNAAGQYDIVSLTWADGEPTVGNTLASFTATDLLLGLQAENAAVRLLGNTGELYATTAWEELNDEWGIILRGASAVGMFASARGRLEDGIAVERMRRRYYVSEGQYLMIDDSPMYVKAPHIFLCGGMDQAVSLSQADPDLSEGGTGDMTENVRTVALKVPTEGVLGIPTARAGKVEVTEDGLRVDYSTYDASTGIRTTKAGSLMRGVFSGSIVKNPNSSTTMTLLTAAQCQSTFGRALDQTKDVVIVTNGDTAAYGGTITGGTNASGALMATISATKSGAIRYNYLVILGA